MNTKHASAIGNLRYWCKAYSAADRGSTEGEDLERLERDVHLAVSRCQRLGVPQNLIERTVEQAARALAR